MKAIILALFMANMAYTQQVKRVKMDSSQFNEVTNTVNELGKGLAEQMKAENKTPVTLKDYRAELMEIAMELYSYGFISLVQYEALDQTIKNMGHQKLCLLMGGIDPALDGPRVCGQRLKNFFITFWNDKVKGKEPNCRLKEEVASAGACCGDLLKLPYVAFEARGSCKQKSQACESHSQCCSNVCNFDATGEKGVCKEVYSCYELKKVGEECPPESPYCEPPCDPNDPNCKDRVSCMEVNHSFAAMGECKGKGASCSENSNCCSDKCESGKCVEKFECSNCASLGMTPRAGQECCSGSYKGINGKCILPFPPLTLPTSDASSEKETFIPWFKRLLGKAIAQILPLAIADEGAQNQLGEMSQECEVDEQGLTNAQNEQYNQCVHKYTNNVAYNSEDLAAAIGVCDQIKAGFLKENEEAGCGAKQLDKKEYRDAYNMPVLNFKEFSDVKKCQFNSYKDAWKARGSLGRNAEIALMGFEVVYTGKGSDMIVAGPSVEASGSAYYGKSIFERASAIARKLRHNRSQMVKRYREIDIEMGCKCLAAFGPQNFEADKQSFFQAECGQYTAYVNQDSIDGESGEDKSSGELGKSAQIDKSATGISHQKFLIEWLGLRREAQLNFFTQNEALEEEMKHLSEFVSNYPWQSHPDVETVEHQLYRFKVKYISHGWTIFAGVVAAIGAAALAVALTVGTGGTALIIAGIAVAAVGIGGGALHVGLSGGGFDQSYTTSMKDRKLASQSNKCIGWCFQKYDTYMRYFVAPYYDNKAMTYSNLSDNSNHCQVNDNPLACIKSIYLVKDEFKNSERSVQFENYPLLDVALPITVSGYKADQVKNNRTYAFLLNDAFVNKGLPGLRDMNRVSRDVFGGDKHNGVPIIHNRDYNDSVKNKQLEDENYIKDFLIDQGGWVPPTFSDEMKKAFKRGVAKYALCEGLKECAVHSKDLVPSEEKDRGFADLFESEEDANDFANYVYYMHFLWPRLSSAGVFYYPTLGMDGYFQSIYYNLRLAGSFALRNVADINDLYNKYKQDWDKKVSDYGASGGAGEGVMQSRNAKVSENLWQEFATLDFNSSSNLQGQIAKLDQLAKSGKFSGADLGVLNALRNHAIREQEQQKKREHFDKTFGNTDRGKQVASSSQNFLKKLNSPLNSMSMTVGGQQFGGLAGADNSLSSVVPKEIVEKEKTQQAVVRGNPYEGQSSIPSYGAGTSNFGASESAGKNPSMSYEDAQALVDAAQRDDSLKNSVGDTLWDSVSKAYMRNLDRVLVLKSDIERKDKQAFRQQKSPAIKDEKKAELENLLEGVMRP